MWKYMAKAKKNNNTGEPIEKQLWKAADKLRKNIDAAEYKHIVLGLIFLKYISDAFEELFDKLKKGEGEYAGTDPEDKDEYKAENVFLALWYFPGLIFTKGINLLSVFLSCLNLKNLHSKSHYLSRY